jgi:hypothetical protein
MDLRTEYPFWLLDKGLLGSYPSLDHDITTEVAIGYRQACDSYLLCSEAIDQLETLCKKFSPAEFARRPSLQYASFKKDVPCLKKEYELRRKPRVFFRGRALWSMPTVSHMPC